VSERPVLNAFTVPLESGREDPAGYRGDWLRLGPLLGAAMLGATVYLLHPGDSICPYHYEYGNEEWLLALEGRPVLRHPGGEETLDPGDLVCFPEGPAGAHKLTNRTEEPVRVIMFSTVDEPSVGVYPDSAKIGVWPPGKLFREADAVDYWVGELEGGA
jgi:uncharacterized cupin superfamily protein